MVCGNDQRKKRKRHEQFVESQREALDKFIKKKSTNSESSGAETNVESHEKESNPSIENIDTDEPPIPFDIYDPRNSNNLDSKTKDLLIEKEPKRDMNL